MKYDHAIRILRFGIVASILSQISGERAGVEAGTPREALINSGEDGLLTEMAQIKAQIAANSRAIGKICNADMGYFRRKAAHHELISTSLAPCSSTISERLPKVSVGPRPGMFLNVMILCPRHLMKKYFQS